jgi:hypothetical protein
MASSLCWILIVIVGFTKCSHESKTAKAVGNEAPERYHGAHEGEQVALQNVERVSLEGPQGVLVRLRSGA